MGIGIQAPYYPVGALDFSPGFKLMTFGFSDHPSFGNVSAIQAVMNLSTDFKPVFSSFLSLYISVLKLESVLALVLR